MRWLALAATPHVRLRTGRGRASTCHSASASHRCVGNRLAELQLRILWEELLRRHPVIEVLAAPRRTYSNFIHGMRSMPVRISMH